MTGEQTPACSIHCFIVSRVPAHSHIITALPTASTSHNQHPCLEITTKKVCLTIVALPRSHAAVSHEDTWAAGYWLDSGHRLVWCSVNVK